MKDPRFDLEVSHEDALGMSTAGWVLLTFAGLLWLFVFISVRDGSELFPAWAFAQTLLGFALVGAGLSKESRTTILQAQMAPRAIVSEVRERHA